MEPDDVQSAFVLERVRDREEDLTKFRPDALCQFSILNGPLEDERQRVRALLEHPECPLEDACIGSMLGLAIGDALGSPLEFMKVRYGVSDYQDMGQGSHPGPNQFRLKPGQWTDDTSMSLCLADSLLVCRGFNALDLRLRFLNWWHFGYNNAFSRDSQRLDSDRGGGSVGLGGNISMSFREFLQEQAEVTSAGTPMVSGNGSIMRLAPCAVFHHDDQGKAMLVAARQSRTTHQGREASECSRLLAHILLGAYRARMDPAARSTAVAREREATVALREDVITVFRNFDKNDDGIIDLRELKLVLQALDGATWTEARIERLFQIVDADGNSTIEYEEFVQWLCEGEERRDHEDFQSFVRRVLPNCRLPHGEAGGENGQSGEGPSRRAAPNGGGSRRGAASEGRQSARAAPSPAVEPPARGNRRMPLRARPAPTARRAQRRGRERTEAPEPAFQSSDPQEVKEWLLGEWIAAFRSPLYSVQCLAQAEGEGDLTADRARCCGVGEMEVVSESLPVRAAAAADSPVTHTLPRGTVVTVEFARDDYWATDAAYINSPVQGFVSRASDSGIIQLEREGWQRDYDWTWKRRDYEYSSTRTEADPSYIGSYAMDNLSMALHCVWTTSSFREALLKCVNMGGDADTVGAVTGQIAGAIYGASAIPARWCEKLERWDGGDIALKAWLLFHKNDEELLARAVKSEMRP